MRKWKFFLSLGLSAMLAAAGPMAAYAASPEFSKTAQEWERLRDNVLEYDEIADLVHEYNTTVAANLTQYAKTKGKTVEDITNQYQGAAAAYSDLAANATDDLTVIGAELGQRQAEISADDNVDDGENDRLTYAKAEASLVRQAQGLMNTYHQLLIKKELQESSISYLEQQLQSTTTMQGVGMVTAADILSSQQLVQSAQAALISIDAQIEETRMNLAIMTGWKADGNPEIRELPATDFGRIEAMSPSSDKEKALENDYTLAIEKRRLEHSGTQENKDLYTTNVKKAEDSVKSAVDLGYQTVLQAKTAYDQAQVALTVASNNFNTTSRMYEIGMASQIDCIGQQHIRKDAQISLQLREMELFQAMEEYDWLTKGLASS